MSAYEIPNLRFSAEAGAAVARRRFVKINAAEQGVQADAVGEAVVGVSSQPTQKAGEVLEIYDGIVIVESAAAINAGTRVMTDATGMAVAYDSATATNVVAGYAATTSTAAGELISVKL